MVLLHFHQLEVNRDGALAGVDFERPFRTALCDKDPSVMSAALCALQVWVRRACQRCWASLHAVSTTGRLPSLLLPLRAGSHGQQC